MMRKVDSKISNFLRGKFESGKLLSGVTFAICFALYLSKLAMMLTILNYQNLSVRDLKIQIRISLWLLALPLFYGCGSSTDAVSPQPTVTIDAIFLPYDSTDNFGTTYSMPGTVLGHFSNIPADQPLAVILISGSSAAVDIHDTNSFRYVDMYGYRYPNLTTDMKNFNFSIRSGSGTLNGFLPGQTIYFKGYGFTSGSLQTIQDVGKRPIYSGMGPESNLISVYWQK
jgi:hypothetical protein